MTSATELVLTNSGGPLSIIAGFAPIEVDIMNRAGRASTDLAFRQLAEAYMRSARIRPFIPKLTDIGLSARDIVKKTIQAIAVRTKTKGEDVLKGLVPKYLESRLLLSRVSQDMLDMTKLNVILPALKNAGFVETRRVRRDTITMSDEFDRTVIVPMNLILEKNIVFRIYMQATAAIRPKK